MKQIPMSGFNFDPLKKYLQSFGIVLQILFKNIKGFEFWQFDMTAFVMELADHWFL
jgi:hypothetical protein